MAEYLAELRKLAINCEFGNFLGDALYDRLVCGLKDEATQWRLLIEVDFSLKKAFEIIQGIEAATKNAGEIQSNGQQKSVELNAVTPSKHSKQLSKNTVNTVLTMHCPRCLGSGHEAAVCRFKTAKCHKYNKEGHTAKHAEVRDNDQCSQDKPNTREALMECTRLPQVRWQTLYTFTQYQRAYLRAIRQT